MTFRIEVFKGSQTAPYIQTLAEMRMREFREFPYLYVGKLEDEIRYTSAYTTEPQALLVIAFQDNEIVGLYSGMPLECPALFVVGWAETMKAQGIDTSNYFYAGELIIEPRFRKMGLGSKLMYRLIEEVKDMNFEAMMQVTAIRPLDHPLRPKDYFDSDTIWGRYGLVKTPIVFSTKWQTLQPDGTSQEEENDLACWIKKM
ncbi:MAG: GNAT family N-acetyltransferase [Alphaproteobacteria bacterium]|jgi:GNAT superfamily N-acetyltransferase|nr:GNAT family N-acetyltransferase [Alphaproteobacteria bacterium]